MNHDFSGAAALAAFILDPEILNAPRRPRHGAYPHGQSHFSSSSKK
jgi:hypothetical protein